MDSPTPETIPTDQEALSQKQEPSQPEKIPSSEEDLAKRYKTESNFRLDLVTVLDNMNQSLQINNQLLAQQNALISNNVEEDKR